MSEEAVVQIPVSEMEGYKRLTIELELQRKVLESAITALGNAGLLPPERQAQWEEGHPGERYPVNVTVTNLLSLEKGKHYVMVVPSDAPEEYVRSMREGLDQFEEDTGIKLLLVVDPVRIEGPTAGAHQALNLKGLGSPLNWYALPNSPIIHYWRHGETACGATYEPITDEAMLKLGGQPEYCSKCWWKNNKAKQVLGGMFNGQQWYVDYVKARYEEYEELVDDVKVEWYAWLNLLGLAVPKAEASAFTPESGVTENKR